MNWITYSSTPPAGATHQVVPRFSGEQWKKLRQILTDYKTDSGRYGGDRFIERAVPADVVVNDILDLVQGIER